jgi:hypothetical protein
MAGEEVQRNRKRWWLSSTFEAALAAARDEKMTAKLAPKFLVHDNQVLPSKKQIGRGTARAVRRGAQLR